MFRDEMIKINNWDKWQSFRKDRGSPPWIKLHRCLMTNSEWAMLSDSEKGQLVSLWIVAADKDGTLPTDNPKILRKIAQLDEDPNIQNFIDLGFFAANCQPDDNQVTTTCQPDDAPEERRGEKKREEEKRKDTVNKLPDDCVKFSEDFYSFLSEKGGKKNPTKKDIKSGAEAIDKLVRIDKWDLKAEIRPALQWGVKDHFWSKQVRSLSPLRKKGKNSETKFANLFSSFSARDVTKSSNGDRKTFDEIRRENTKQACIDFAEGN